MVNIYFRPFNGAEDWKWINDILPLKWCEDTTAIMAVDADTHTVVGAGVMDNWTHNSVQAHLILTSPMVLRAPFLECLFGYAFLEVGVKYVYALVPGDKKKALRLNKRLGFETKCVMPEGFAPGIDYILMGMSRESCTVLPKETKKQEAA